MSDLDRITIKYVEREDRIRLAGQTSQGTGVIVWATRRLLDRLLPRLVQRLENSVEGVNEDTRANAIHAFAQEAARSTSAPQPPVRPSSETAQWLAQSIDVSFASRSVRLTFYGDDTQCAELTLEESKLRQLLNILYDMYRRADWPTQGWPQWIGSAKSGEAAEGSRIH